MRTVTIALAARPLLVGTWGQPEKMLHGGWGVPTTRPSSSLLVYYLYFDEAPSPITLKIMVWKVQFLRFLCNLK